MKLALLDIDGLLANDTHRVKHALNKHWETYFAPENVAADELWPEGKALADSLEQDGWTVGYLTGRRYVLRGVTERWLDKHLLPFGRLIMRDTQWWQDKVKVSLSEFKVGVLEELSARPDIEEIRLYDDDPVVVETVNREVSSEYVSAIFCGWNVKPEALIHKATA